MNKIYKEIYDEFLDCNNETASEEIRQSYADMYSVFEEYLCAIQEDTFRRAYEFGYAKGVEATKNKKTAQ